MSVKWVPSEDELDKLVEAVILCAATEPAETYTSRLGQLFRDAAVNMRNQGVRDVQSSNQSDGVPVHA